MEQDLSERLKALEEKIDKTYVSAEKTRKYFLTIIIVSVVAFALPLVGLFFAVPTMLSSYNELLTM